MSGSNAFASDMPDHEPPWGSHGSDRTGWDDDTADRILDGLSPEDASPDSVGVAKILAAASAPASREELSGETFAVTAFRVASLELCQTRPTRSRSVVARLATPKAAAIAMALGVAVNGGLAAAGTGSLPRPVQRAASEILREVGVDVPGADSHVRGHHLTHADVRPSSSNSGPADAGGSGGPISSSGLFPRASSADGTLGRSRTATSESNASTANGSSSANASRLVSPANSVSPTRPVILRQASASSTANPAGPRG